MTTPRALGSVELRTTDGRRAWRIRCEPHIRLRLKRIFGKVDKASHDWVELSDTIENAREVSWFLQRYPLTIASPDREHLLARAEEHVRRGEAVAQILADGYVPPPFGLALPPRDYQRIAADFVLKTGGALIADDVGIGKTVEAICTLTDPRCLPAIVVTLTSLQTQWRDELAKFAPHLRTHILKATKPYDVAAAMRGRRRRDDATRALPGVNAFPDVLICNYQKLSGWAETLAGLMKAIIFDEIQELRIPKSDKYKAAAHIAKHADVRSGYSATPVYNYGGEMFWVLDVLRPGALGERDEFVREWCGSVGYGNAADKARVKDPKAFGTYLRSEGLMLRRTRAEVGRELPPLTKVVQHIEADPEALERVSGSAAELARLILADAKLERGAKFQAAEQLSYLLRQATGIAKAPFVAEFVRLLVESGEKVLLYGWHRAVYDVWMERLRDLSPVLYTGSESTVQKDASKAAFLDPKGAQVMIMSLRAGAGLDGLQRCCRTVVFGELDWSPGVHEQCLGRPHRDGQVDPVAGYFLVSDTGSDPVIADVLGLKKAQIEGIRDPAGGLLERLDTGGGRVEQLAAAYLRQRGLEVPETAAADRKAVG